MRKHTCAVAVDFVADGHVVAQDGHVLHARPSADSAVPADNCALHPCVLLDLAVLKQHRALQAHTLADLNIRSNDHVGSNLAVLANLCRRVDHNVTTVDVRLAGGCKELAALLGKRREVETCAGKEVLGLTDIHPETFKVEAVELTVLDDRRESLLLDGCRAQFNAVEY